MAEIPKQSKLRIMQSIIVKRKAAARRQNSMTWRNRLLLARRLATWFPLIWLDACTVKCSRTAQRTNMEPVQHAMESKLTLTNAVACSPWNKDKHESNVWFADSLLTFVHCELTKTSTHSCKQKTNKWLQKFAKKIEIFDVIQDDIGISEVSKVSWSISSQNVSTWLDLQLTFFNHHNLTVKLNLKMLRGSLRWFSLLWKLPKWCQSSWLCALLQFCNFVISKHDQHWFHS